MIFMMSTWRVRPSSLLNEMGVKLTGPVHPRMDHIFFDSEMWSYRALTRVFSEVMENRLAVRGWPMIACPVRLHGGKRLLVYRYFGNSESITGVRFSRTTRQAGAHLNRWTARQSMTNSSVGEWFVLVIETRQPICRFLFICKNRKTDSIWPKVNQQLLMNDT